MKKLYKHELNFNKTLPEFLDIADGGNVLSKIVIDNMDFQEGSFYTLLPHNADLEQIYKFKLGGILPQNEEIDYTINGEKATYSIIPTVDEEISFSLKKYLQKGYSCIMDDVTRNLKDKYIEQHSDQSDKYILSIKNEIIYLLNEKEVSVEIIEEILCKSRAIWHSLGILLNTKVVFSSKILNLEELNRFLNNAKIVFVNAYDGEGYIFWEKHK